MQHTTAQARITQKDTFYKALHCESGQYIQLRCGTGRKPRLTDAKRATHFRSREQAIECLRPLGEVAVEIECHVA